MAARALALGVAVLASTACASAPVQRGVPAKLASASSDPAIVAAFNWLNLLKANQPEKLLEVSALPLRVGQAQGLGRKRCDNMIGDETRMERLIGCLHETVSYFFERFGADDRTTLEAIEPAPDWRSGATWWGPPRPGERAVRAIIDDGGVRIEVTLLLIPGENEPRLRVATVAFKEVLTLSQGGTEVDRSAYGTAASGTRRLTALGSPLTSPSRTVTGTGCANLKR